jgi:predicted alpha-1,2-mannosidase
LEYAYDDWCIAQVAKHLGKTAEYDKYMKRSKYYQNLFDPKYNLFRGKNSDGSWYEPFHPRYAAYGNPHCVEGNTWQYSFFAPHDMEGLSNLMGGKDGLEMMLDSLFTQSSELLGEDTEDVTGLIGQYAHGNEPSHHIAYLYASAGQPWKTAEKVRYIMKEFYHDDPDGVIGNEDAGQMSAWYVLSSLGFYPVFPASTEYVFGSPLFEKATIHLPAGRSFTVETENNSPENIYIQQVELNGEEHNKISISHQDIMNGGVLKFVMSDTPNYKLP